MSNIIQQLERTSLSKSDKTNEMLNNIVYNAFHNAQTDEQEIAIASIAYKYDLGCLDLGISCLDLRF